MTMEDNIEVVNQIYNNIVDLNTGNIVNILKSNNVDFNVILPDKGIGIMHLVVGVEPLAFAEEVTQLLLNNGGNPNERSDEGMTPLHVAAAWGRQGIVVLLLNNGADPYILDNDSKTPLKYASENHHLNIIDILLEYFQSDRYQYNSSPEMYSIKLDKIILDNGCFKGEYECDDDAKIENENNALANSFRKSLFVREWCDSNQKVINNHKFLDYDREIVKNTNNGIMFKKPFSYLIDKGGDEDKDKTANTSKQSSHYHSCNDSLEVISNPKESESSSSDDFSEIYDSDDDVTLNDDNSLSGIQTLKFTRNEENNLYSVLQKNTVLNDDSLKNSSVKTFTNSPSRLSNYVFPRSPVPLPHKNYSTKTTLGSGKKQEGKDDKKNMNGVEVELFQNNTPVIINQKALDVGFIDSYFGSDLSQSCSIASGAINETIASVVEEHKYEDKEAGVVLIEKRVLTTPVPMIGEICDKSIAQSVISSVSSLPMSIDYDTDNLRRELTIFGVTPGPITLTTKRVYLKKLQRLKKDPNAHIIQSDSKKKTYTVELEKTLRDPDWNSNLSLYIDLENKIIKQFDMPNPKMRWREGVIKSSFTYLLLDPRVTNNLPNRTNDLSKTEIWKLFLDSIFYIGKGKRSRPYSHLYQAVGVYNAGKRESQDKKVQNILDIWKDNLGVVCLHIFQNVIPVEAYTREAAMIDVIALKNLKNIKPGNYYGVAASWSLKEKKQLGLYLLYRAMLILLNEGERQLRPFDIC